MERYYIDGDGACVACSDGQWVRYGSVKDYDDITIENIKLKGEIARQRETIDDLRNPPLANLQNVCVELQDKYNKLLMDHRALQDKFVALVSPNTFDEYITDEGKKYDSLNSAINAAYESLYPRVIYGRIELGRTERISQWIPKND